MSSNQFIYVVAGILLVLGGYWLGFVGQTSTEYRVDGPQGPGNYEVETTYPVAGIIGILGGISMVFRGVVSETDQPSPEEESQSHSEPQDTPTVQTSDWSCPSCGESLSSTAKFCTNCGTSVSG